MEIKHTPAPWKIGIPGTVISDSSEGITIGGAINKKYYGGNLICESVSYNNAKLIAAAPELLDACEAMLEYFKTKGEENSVLAKSIELTVKKATL